MCQRVASAAAFGICAVLLAGGCSNGPPAATISGTVTVDGKPLDKGIISFSPADGTGVPATGEVRDGKYEVRTTAGLKTVQLSAPVVTGTRKEYNGPGAKEIEVTAESLPDKYHNKSDIKFDVKAGPQTKDWPLESKKGGK